MTDIPTDGGCVTPTGWLAFEPLFAPSEFRCHASGMCAMKRDFMERLLHVRKRFGHPMVVTSGYRSKQHPLSVATLKRGRDSAHMYGRAGDFHIRRDLVFELVAAAQAEGMTGIGLRAHGPDNHRLVHLDDMPDDGRFHRPRVWTYP